MADKIGTLLVDLVGQTASLRKDFRDVVSELNSFKKSFKYSFTEINNAAQIFRAVFDNALTRSVERSIDAAAHMDDLAKQTGIATESLSELGFAAEQNGSSLDSLALGLKGLSSEMAAAQAGSKQSRALFDALGVSFLDGQGNLRGMEELLLETAESFKGHADGAAKAALAQKLFGKSGLELIPFLNQGSDGLRQLMVRARELGLTISTNTGKNANEFNNSLAELKSIGTGLANDIASDLVPNLRDLVKTWTDNKKAAEDVDTIASSIANSFRAIATGALLIKALPAAGFQSVKDLLGWAVELTNLRFGNASLFIQDLASGTAAGRQFAEEMKALWGDAEKKKDELANAAPADGAAAAEPFQVLGEEAEKARKKIDDVISSLRTDYEAALGGASEEARALAENLGKAGLSMADLASGNESAEAIERLTHQVEAQKQFNEEQEKSREKAREFQQTLKDIAFEAALAGKNFKPATEELYEAARAAGLLNEQLEVITGKEEQFKQLSEAMNTKKANEEQKKMIADLKQEAKSYTSDIAQGFTDMALKGEAAWDDIGRAMVERLFNRLINELIDNVLLNFLFGALFGEGAVIEGARADGGPVMGGKTYLVGERGPELFVPSRSGTIVPNVTGMGGGTTIAFYQTNNFAVGIRGEVRAEIAEQFPRIKQAAIEGAVDAARRGGGPSKGLRGF